MLLEQSSVCFSGTVRQWSYVSLDMILLAAQGCDAALIVTALTVQDTCDVLDIQVLTPAWILAQQAALAGASYVSFGHFLSSETKPCPVMADTALIHAARVRYQLPLVAIGGISVHNASTLVAASIDLLAVVQGLFAVSTPAQVTDGRVFLTHFCKSTATDLGVQMRQQPQIKTAMAYAALIDLLADGGLHSGDALGAALGVSRSAIWKKVRSLNTAYGTVIVSTSRGYRLVRRIQLLNTPDYFVSASATWPIHYVDSLESTNTRALEWLKKAVTPPFLLVAEQQTAGRGRRGRPWVSPFAENLYLSLAWPIAQAPKQLEGLSLAVGLAVLRALQPCVLEGLGLKWPNDVLVGDKKIAGILLEVVGDLTDACQVVIGIGVNVNMCATTEVIDQAWTSVRAETGSWTDRSALLEILQKQLAIHLQRHADAGFAGLMTEWNQHDAYAGRLVVLNSGVENVRGIASGVNASGALQITASGVVHCYTGGEITLRVQHDS